LIGQVAHEREVDILLIAEPGVSDEDTVGALTVATGKNYIAISDNIDKVRVFTRIAISKWKKRQSDPINARMAIWSIDIGKPQGILLAVAHFLSKMNANEGEQAMLAGEMAKEISRVEDHVGYERTVVVGDLNMNPFESGVAGGLSLHAVMTKELARRGTRIIQGKKYPFFYNPMWGFFGDRTHGPAGTYYHHAANINDVFWHMFDQVLLRPTLIDSLHDLMILDRIGEHDLLTKQAKLPHRDEYSDHLPLGFRMKLE
jgi:hypothetical protein